MAAYIILEMIDFLEEWKPYLHGDDYMYLTTFVDNIHNNIPNRKMIILSGKNGRNGKTTLINQIIQYIGENNCRECNLDGFSFSLPIKPLVVITGGIDAYHKKLIPVLHTIITYTQSVIADTIRIEQVSPTLLEVSKVINMVHQFE
jgi:energy-coupling factor transporter ATP-binding protein EcfA2